MKDKKETLKMIGMAILIFGPMAYFTIKAMVDTYERHH